MINQLRMMYCLIKYLSMSSQRPDWKKIMLFLKSRFSTWRINVTNYKPQSKQPKKTPRSIQRDTTAWDLTMITTRCKTWEITWSTQEQCWYNSFRSYHILHLIMRQLYQSYILCLNLQRKSKINLQKIENLKIKLKCKKMLRINLKRCSEQCSKTQKRKVKLQDLAWTHKETPASTVDVEARTRTEMKIENVKYIVNTLLIRLITLIENNYFNLKFKL